MVIRSKYIANVVGIGIVALGLFVLVAKAFPDLMPNRIHTWEKRISRFFSGESAENYQVEKAKIAIATGGVTGKGPGKSVQKNFLPQSSSDFIYAIIVEEYGLVGAVFSTVYLFFVAVSNCCFSKKSNHDFWNAVNNRSRNCQLFFKR